MCVSDVCVMWDVCVSDECVMWDVCVSDVCVMWDVCVSDVCVCVVCGMCVSDGYVSGVLDGRFLIFDDIVNGRIWEDNREEGRRKERI